MRGNGRHGRGDAEGGGDRVDGGVMRTVVWLMRSILVWSEKVIKAGVEAGGGGAMMSGCGNATKWSGAGRERRRSQEWVAVLVDRVLARQ